ncbi:MAG: hypothetical protein AAF533_13090 [Acidobacteriota bacterium]
MSSPLLRLVVLALACLSFLYLASPSRDVAPSLGGVQHHRPEGYVRRVNRLIEAGIVRHDCSRREVTVDLDSAQVLEGWSHWRSWIRNSYLPRDVELFNEGVDRSLFLIDGCRLRGVSPFSHRVQMPFAESATWRGDLWLGGDSASSELRSSARAVSVVEGAKPARADEQRSVRVGSPRSISAEEVLFHFGGGAGDRAVHVRQVGEQAVVTNQVPHGTKGEVWLHGHRMPTGRVARLEEGDWLHLSRSGGGTETFFFSAGKGPELASTVLRRNGRDHRKFSDLELGWLADARGGRPVPLIETLVRAINRALAQLPPRQARDLVDGVDVELTIDRGLQETLSERLRESCEALAGSAPPFPAGVTVLDGRSGDVLALATWPHPRDVDGHREVDDRRRRRLLLNQNLVRHPVGSAAKPFFLASIAQEHPLLLDLKIDGHDPDDEHDSLFHCRLSSGYQVLSDHARPIDFVSALTRSCNKYTVEIATLALANPVHGVQLDRTIDWPPSSSGVRVAGRELLGAPDLGRFVSRREVRAEAGSQCPCPCNEMSNMQEVPYRHALERLTGVATYQGEAPPILSGEPGEQRFRASYRSTLYDLRPWAPLLEHLTSGLDADESSRRVAWELGAAFTDVAPERVNLGFNSIQRLREEYVSLLLGGATGTWTNVQLAESISRLVTGREVTARMVRDVRASEETPERALDDGLLSPSLDIEDRVWESVLRGMKGVVEGPGGTATELAVVLDVIRSRHPGEDVFLLSKTGSPTNEMEIDQPVARALAALVEDGALSLAPDGRTLKSSSPTLVHALAKAGFGRGRTRLARQLQAVLSRFARESDDLSWQDEGEVPASIRSPLYVVGGRLHLNERDRLFRHRKKVSERGAVFIFSLIRSPRLHGAELAELPSREQLDHPETRIISVALHLDVGPDSRRAVRLARQVLPELLPLLERPRDEG